jgi:hypothetical protein
MALSILWICAGPNLTTYNFVFHAERELVSMIFENMIDVLFIRWEGCIADGAYDQVP